ncbi:hypothetical protein PM082_009632 [Marasmius tenuissimus]|nr:hypothetical protein PM082_009632 [Marasmius tenuissimus]
MLIPQTIMRLIVDSILQVFRCFVICGWRRRRYAVALITTCFIIDATAGVSMICARMTNYSRLPLAYNLRTAIPYMNNKVELLAYLATVLFVLHVMMNALFTIVIVHKIIKSSAQHILGASTQERYRTVVMLLVESCLLYLIVWIVPIVCFALKLPTIMDNVLIQVAALAPTLLIVRANIPKEEKPTRDGVVYVQSNITTSGSLDEEIVLHTIRESNKSETS